MVAVPHIPSAGPLPVTTTLDRLPLLAKAEVVAVVAPALAPEWQAWLEDLGFLSGERVAVLARACPGGDPLVVRVGSSTFALRTAEAAFITYRVALGAGS